MNRLTREEEQVLLRVIKHPIFSDTRPEIKTVKKTVSEAYKNYKKRVALEIEHNIKY